jgi:hypothetical protein
MTSAGWLVEAGVPLQFIAPMMGQSSRRGGPSRGNPRLSSGAAGRV